MWEKLKAEINKWAPQQRLTPQQRLVSSDDELIAAGLSGAERVLAMVDEAFNVLAAQGADVHATANGTFHVHIRGRTYGLKSLGSLPVVVLNEQRNPAPPESDGEAPKPIIH